MPLRRSASLLLALSVAAAACSSSSTDVAPVGGPGDAPGGREVDAASGDLAGASAFASGSRLKMRSVVGPDGAAVVVGFVDTALDGEPCTFQPDGEGTYRCLPSSVRRDALVGQGHLGADCDGPEVYEEFARDELGGDCGAPRFLVTSTRGADPCRESVAVERITTRVVAKDAQRSRREARCGVLPPPARDGFAIVTREPVPLTAFVRAHTAIGGTGRLRARTLVGEDGSSAFLGWYDAELESPCSFVYAGTPARAQCVPPTLRVVASHRGSCDGPPVDIARAVPQCGVSLRFAAAVRSATEACSEHFEVRRLLGLVDDAFTDGKFGCTAEHPNGAPREVGEDIGDRLATVDVPARRLAPTSPARLYDVGMTRAHWLDRELGMECSYQRVQDGSLRCVPLGAGPELLFGDPECSTPHVAYRDSELAEVCGLVERARVVEQERRCPRRIRVFERGAVHDLLPGYTRDASGACVEAYHLLGAHRATEVGLDRLAVGTVVLAE